MSKLMKYAVVAATLGAVLAPSFALAVVQPTVPPGVGGQALTGSSVVRIINDIVNILLGVSVVIAVGFFVYGGVRYAVGQPEVGKKTMFNAAIGIAAILGVGLVVNTIAGLINRGLNLG